MSNRWYRLINEINKYITDLTLDFNYDEIELLHLGGRKFNYDILLNLTYKENIIKSFKLLQVL